jgi:hypothetical protein
METARKGIHVQIISPVRGWNIHNEFKKKKLVEMGEKHANDYETLQIARDHPNY